MITIINITVATANTNDNNDHVNDKSFTKK